MSIEYFFWSRFNLMNVSKNGKQYFAKYFANYSNPLKANVFCKIFHKTE